MMTPTTPFAVAVAVADAGEIPPPLVHLGFNLYSTGFVAATATGLRVFSCFNSPLKKVLARDVEVCPEDDCGGSSSSSQGGWKVAIVEMFNEAFAAVVFRREKDDGSGGTVDKICFWSIPNGRMYCMHKTLPFDVVRGVRLVGEYLLVAGDERAVLYELPHAGAPPKKVKVVETAANPLGLGAVVQPDGNARFVLVAPQKMKGMLQVHRLAEDHVYVRAHYSSVAAMALSVDGRLLATAGSKGTLVRIFSTSDGKLLQVMRRGSDRADIYSIAFSPDSEWLAVSSDKGTVHVFRINICLTTSSKAAGQYATQSYGAKAIKKSISSIKDIFTLGYFDPERSVAQFRLRENVKYFVTFGKIPNKNIVLIIGMDGSFYRCQFDPANGGEMKQLEYMNFLNM